MEPTERIHALDLEASIASVAHERGSVAFDGHAQHLTMIEHPGSTSNAPRHRPEDEVAIRCRAFRFRRHVPFDCLLASTTNGELDHPVDQADSDTSTQTITISEQSGLASMYSSITRPSGEKPEPTGLGAALNPAP